MNISNQIRDEIFNVVWSACDTFRGTIDPAQYKDYILTMLFVKYLSDVRKDRIAELSDKYKGNMDRVNRALRNERFIIPEACTFEALYAKRNTNDVGQQIDIALDGIEASNPEKLEGIFRNITFNSDIIFGLPTDRNPKLKTLLKDFNNEKLDLRPSRLKKLGVHNDIIGDVYEFLIDRFASNAGKKAGEFYTPSSVSTLLAQLVAPKPGERICDPSCGSFSLAIKAAKEVGSNNFSIYGQEINSSTFALARMNAYLHKIDNAVIKWGDTLNNPQLKQGDQLMKFDVVVANPPFSLKKWQADKDKQRFYDRFQPEMPPNSKADYAFILHMIHTVFEETGRVGVVVPHGVLFRGSAEGRIREQLIDKNLLEAVIGLPANLFFGTGIPAAILIYNKGKQGNTDVLFIDASKRYESGKNQNILTEAHRKEILATYEAFKVALPIEGDEGKVVEDKFAYRATLAEIQENDYNLNIPDTFEEEALVDIEATQKRIQQIENNLSGIKSKMSGYLKELGFSK